MTDTSGMTDVAILKSWKPLDVAVTLSGGVVLLLILSAVTSAWGSETLALLFGFDEEGNIVTWYATLLWLSLAVVLRLMTSKYQRMRHHRLGRATSALAYLAVFPISGRGCQLEFQGSTDHSRT